MFFSANLLGNIEQTTNQTITKTCMHKHKYTITLNLLTYIGALEPARGKAISGTKVNYKLLDLGPITPTAVKLIAIKNRLNCSLVVFEACLGLEDTSRRS